MENPSVKWGLIAGLGVMITSLLFYLVNVNWFFSISSYVSWIVYIACMVFAVKDMRGKHGFISFKDAFSTAFIVYAISSLMYFIFYYLMFNVIDPGLAEIQQEIAREAMESFSSFMTEEQIEEAMARVEDQSMNIGTLGVGYLFNLIFPGAIMAAIIAIILKKDNPNTGIV